MNFGVLSINEGETTKWKLIPYSPATLTHNPKAYSGACQTSKMEPFTSFAKCSILDAWPGSE